MIIFETRIGQRIVQNQRRPGTNHVIHNGAGNRQTACVSAQLIEGERFQIGRRPALGIIEDFRG